MKYLLLLMFSMSLQAAPVLNKNMASSGINITIWPDHKDPDQFYFAPTMLKLAKDEDSKVRFSALDYKDGKCGMFKQCRRLLMTAFFESSYRVNDFEEAKLKILSLRPKARFSPIPFMSSKVEFGVTMKPFIVDHNCSPMAGQSTDLVPCSIILNEKGIFSLVPRLQEGSLIAFNFKYKITGVSEKADPQFENSEAEYSIAVNLGGQDLKNHPDLVP